MTVKVNPERALTVGLGIVVLVGVVALFTGALKAGGSAGAKPFVSRLPPVEFLYLDGPRILNYVAQLEGGQIGAVHRISKEIQTATGEASSPVGKIGASTQRENEADSTLTRTEASELGLMLDDLANDEEPGVELHSVELEKPQDLAQIHEGWLVEFKTHDLLSPGYIRPYVVVKQSATLAALFPQAERERERAISFAKQIGPNPRITFAVAPPAPLDGGEPLKILLPMQYHDLTTERSLLEKGRDQYTGGELTVVGKVIRVFPAGDPSDCPGQPGCARPEPEYTDFATREIWRHPLEGASNYLVRQVSHSCQTLVSGQLAEAEQEAVAPGRGGAAGAHTIEGRRCFLTKLRRQTRLYAPGAVILPLAVYK